MTPIVKAAGYSRRGFLKLWTRLVALPALWRTATAAGKVTIPKAQTAPIGNFQKALDVALGGLGWQASPEIKMDVPPLAENGAMVPMTVESLLPDTRRILIFAEKNPGPLLAECQFEPGADPWVALRLKLNDSGPVLAVAESAGQFYGAQTTFKVMVGGCG